MATLLIRWLIVTVVLVVAGPMAALVCGVAPPAFEPGSAGAAPGALLGWSLVSNATIAAVLVGLASQSRVSGRRLGVGLFVVAFGIAHAAGLIEAYVFGVIDAETSLRLVAMSALNSLAGCAAAAWLVSRRQTSAPAEAIDWRPDPVRLSAVSLLYLAAYFAAGTLVFPYIEAFYATRTLPATSAIVALQLFVRGPFFGLILAWLVATTRGSHRTRALWAGLTMSLIGGVAPLLMPNPYFTDAVRWAHFVETSVSNLIFGIAAGWILARPTAARFDAAPSLE